MSEIPAFDEDVIEAWVGSRSFNLGLDYAADGAIYEARRQGMTLRARCTGSSGGPYRVSATFKAGGIETAHCSCPVGADGACKHVAALLLTWLARPDDFTSLPETGQALEARSKDELIALIKQMIRQEPDLELLLETPLPGARKRHAPADPAIYRKQAAAAFRGAYDEYGAEVGVAADLDAIIDIGDGFRDEGDFAQAATVYDAVAAETLENYESFSDEGGELSEVVGQCVEGLGACLAGAQDGATREMVLRALFAIYHFDVDFGGVGLSDEVPDLVVAHATPDERHRMAGWVREVLPTGDDWSADFARKQFGAFLLDLEADTLDDESYLRVCRETGRTRDLVDRLLSLGRLEEALGEADHVGDWPLLEIADLLVERGHGSEAEALVRRRAETGRDIRLLTWLKDRAAAHGDVPAALALAERLFRAMPSLPLYQELRGYARQLGRWEELRADLRAFLDNQQTGDLLIQVFLEEGEVERALDAVQRGLGYGGRNLEVARAAEETRPVAALEIYRPAVERLIEAQGRENYKQAARLLIRMRAIYERLGRAEESEAYLQDLRERFRRLRALKEELAAAGL